MGNIITQFVNSVKRYVSEYVDICKMEFKALGNLSLVQQQFTVSIAVIKLEIAENKI